MNRQAIEEWLIAKIREVQRLDGTEIDVRAPLEKYGLGSVQAVSLVGDLEEWLDRSLPSTLFWDYTSIEAIANHLAENTN
jgi:acyl carrier protein